MSPLSLCFPVIVLLASAPYRAWDIELLTGDWGELYEEGTSAGSMQFFRFDPEKGAVWVQSYRGKDVLHFEFPAESISEDNGLVILTTYPEDNFMVRFVVSAYRISEFQDTGLATGYLYMFQKLDDDWMLFNSFPFRGRPLDPGEPIYSHDQLRNLSDE